VLNQLEQATEEDLCSGNGGGQSKGVLYACDEKEAEQLLCEEEEYALLNAEE